MTIIIHHLFKMAIVMTNDPLDEYTSKFAKDAVHVYFLDTIVEGADPETFEIEEASGMPRDKNGCYNWIGEPEADCPKAVP